MRHLPRLASLVLDQHHAILPSAAASILRVLEHRMGDIDLSDITPDEPVANAFVGRPVFGKDERYRGYRLTDKGVAIVPIHGELVNRGSWLGSHSGLVSYEGLRHSLRQAADDPNVRAIVLDINSPGGMVAGMPETAATVRAIARTKPVVAVANDMAASAAYGIASGATKIIASDTAMVGSIGTLYVHTDRSKALEKAGLKVTLIHAGARKVEGNSIQPLADDVRGRIQERTEKLQASFISLVREGRPHLTEAAIRATEADVYYGAEAVEQGLADAVGTFDGAVAEAESGAVKPRLAVVPASQGRGAQPAPNSQPQPQKVAAKMTEPTGAERAQADPGDWASQLRPDQLEAIAARLQETVTASAPAPAAPAAPAPAASATPQPQAASTDDAFARGRAAERERISAILNSEEAKARPAAAQVLATTSGDSAEAVIAMLGKMPKETAAAGAAAFYAAAAANGARPQVRHTAQAEDVARPTLADRQKAAMAQMNRTPQTKRA